MEPKTVFLFPGQGSQKIGMGRAWAEAYPEARAAFDEASGALGFDVAALCWQGPEAELQLTANTQPAILTASVAIARVLAARGFAPASLTAVAGHSLGESLAQEVRHLDPVGVIRSLAQRIQHQLQFLRLRHPAGQRDEPIHRGGKDRFLPHQRAEAIPNRRLQHEMPGEHTLEIEPRILDARNEVIVQHLRVVLQPRAGEPLRFRLEFRADHGLDGSPRRYWSNQSANTSTSPAISAQPCPLPSRGTSFAVFPISAQRFTKISDW